MWGLAKGIKKWISLKNVRTTVAAVSNERIASTVVAIAKLLKSSHERVVTADIQAVRARAPYRTGSK
jgi:hypothetical protein